MILCLQSIFAKAPLCIAIVGAACLAPRAEAATVFYYNFDGAAGTTAGAITDLSGNGNNGVAGTVGGGAAVAPVYSTTRLQGYVTDGVGGAVLNATNDTSLRFTNAGVANNNYATNVGGIIRVAANEQINTASFTFEAFVKVDNLIQYGAIGGKIRETNSPTWMLDSAPSGHVNAGEPTNMNMKLRFDSHAVGAPANNTSAGFNQSPSFGSSISDPSSVLGDGWYHVALTYDDATNTARVYRNYVLVGTHSLSASGAGDLVFTNLDMVIGADAGSRAFDGWMDEVRFSNTVLNTDNFLRVVPEPGRGLLLLLALGTVVLRRRR